jgi:hypothetical protein
MGCNAVLGAWFGIGMRVSGTGWGQRNVTQTRSVVLCCGFWGWLRAVMGSCGTAGLGVGLKVGLRVLGPAWVSALLCSHEESAPVEVV